MCPDDLGEIRFNIDQLLVRGSSVYGWGWIFHTQRIILKIDLLAKTEDHYLRFPCEYLLERRDVAKQYGTTSAANSGFRVSCVLSANKVSEYLLELHFADGMSRQIDVTPFVSVRQSATPRIRRWIRRAWHYIGRRDLRTLFRKTEEKARILLKNRNLKTFRGSHLRQYLTAGQSSGLALIVDHNLGGGANLYRQGWIEKRKEDGKNVLLLYYDFPSLSYRIQFISKNNSELIKLESIEEFSEMARNIRFEEIFLNNVYSFDDPLAIVALLPVLKYGTGAKLVIAIHDYFSICPSCHLLDYTDRFCGVPDIRSCQSCLSSKHRYFMGLMDCKDIGLWRKTWGACLNSADKIICFSNSSVLMLGRAYPNLDSSKFEVIPHVMDHFSKRSLVLHHEGPLNIGIVGTINSTDKGAQIVMEMARIIKEQHIPARITVIGELEVETPESVVQATGHYEKKELPELIEKSGANIFFLPSIIPETFSYVTEELIQLNLPLAVFDLGAPAERVAQYANGLIIHEIDAEHALHQLIAFHERYRQLNTRCGFR